MKQKLTCLLVDDDHDDQEIFTNAINEIAPEVDCFIASDGVEAIQILLQGDVRPDYIFLDINMPRMNGCEFLRAIKEMSDFKDIPVVVHSTSARPKEMENLIKLGAFGIHIKEYNSDSVRRMLHKYLLSLKFADKKHSGIGT